MQLKKTTVLLIAAILLAACGKHNEMTITQTAAGEQDNEAEAAMIRYEEFLKSDEMYTLTATTEYPRGDSRSVYAFSDCTGDGIPELHIDSVYKYHIYTYRNGQVVSLASFSHEIMPSVIGLKDGAFIGISRTDMNVQKMATSARKPDFVRDDLDYNPDVFVSREQYYYKTLDSFGEIAESLYFTQIFEEGIDSDGNYYYFDGNEYERDEWENLTAPYMNLLADTSLHLEWEYVFPQKEWYYLDSLEEGDGSEYEDASKEWQVYKQILSGDFSCIKDIDERARLKSKYMESLAESTGRSRWKYILTDLNGDGINELFIRCYPEPGDYSSVDFPYVPRTVMHFIYIDDEIVWDFIDIPKERIVPLADGRLLKMLYYNYSLEMYLGKYDTDFRFIPEVMWERVTINYNDFREREWYEENLFGKSLAAYYAFGEREWVYPDDMTEEGEYYFIQKYEEGNGFGEFAKLPGEVWQLEIDILEGLLIPDSNWEKASVFMPNRYQEIFFYG